VLEFSRSAGHRTYPLRSLFCHGVQIPLRVFNHFRTLLLFQGVGVPCVYAKPTEGWTDDGTDLGVAGSKNTTTD
jgi:hypothetical protein